MVWFAIVRAGRIVDSKKPKKSSISKDVDAKLGDPLDAIKAARAAETAHEATADGGTTAAQTRGGTAPAGTAVDAAGKRVKTSVTTAPAGPRKGFALFGLVVGVMTGLLAFAVTELWIDPVYRPVGGQTFLVFIAVTSAALLLIASPDKWLRGAPYALGVGALIAGPTAFMLSAQIDAKNLSTFPPMFWFLVGAPVTGVLLIALSRAALAPSGKRYTELFSSGVTLPLVASGSMLFALLGAVMLFAFAGLARSANVNFVHQTVQQPWFMLPFLGAIGGLSIGLVKSLEPVLGAVRYAVLWAARFAMPLAAVFSIVFLTVLVLKGPQAFFAPGIAAPALLGLSLIGMLIFNAVYQNGEGAPPPGWLRLSSLVALIAFPMTAGVAAWLFAARIGELGMTPARLFGFIFAGLASLYGAVGLAGAASELRWKTDRWMPIVARMNAGMAMLWAIALLLTASPLINTWSLSARSQENFVLSGRANVDTFDYGYLRFALGDAGVAALNRLAQTTAHPKADAIRDGSQRALGAATYSLYKNPPPAPQPAREAQPTEPAAALERQGVDALDFNPKDASETTP